MPPEIRRLVTGLSLAGNVAGIALMVWLMVAPQSQQTGGESFTCYLLSDYADGSFYEDYYFAE